MNTDMPAGSPARAGLTRRALLRLTSAAGAMAGFGLAPGRAMAACGPGGTLAANMKDPPNFDIIGNATSWLPLTLGPCYNGLMTVDPARPGELVPELATSWEVSEDLKTVTFHLRDGVTFHDGQPFTSADVKATFDLQRNPPAGYASPRQGYLSAVEAIDTPDPLTVVFRLAHPQPAFLPILATGWMLVMPKHILDRDGHMQNAVIGTGPFRFHDYQVGVRLDLVRNADYWDEGKPYLDGITFYVAEDPSTLDAYFQTGQIQFYSEMTSDSGLRFEGGQVEGVDVQRVVALNPSAITMNGRSGPFADKRVRQAVSLAVNRQEAIDVLERGQATIGGFIPPGPFALPPERLAAMPGYGPDYEANLTRARALLAEAGYPDGFATTMLVRRNNSHEERAVLMQGQLARIGIAVTLDVQESAMFFENFNSANFEIVSQGGIAYPVNDPDVVFGRIHTAGDGNMAGVVNAEMDALYAEQANETDPARRIEIAHRMEEIALDEASRIILFYQNKFVGLSDRVAGYLASGNPDDVTRMAGVCLTA